MNCLQKNQIEKVGCFWFWFWSPSLVGVATFFRVFGFVCLFVCVAQRFGSGGAEAIFARWFRFSLSIRKIRRQDGNLTLFMPTHKGLSKNNRKAISSLITKLLGGFRSSWIIWNFIKISPGPSGICF